MGGQGWPGPGIPVPGCTHREKIDLADSEKRTPEVKFRLFYFIIIPEIAFLKNPHCMAWRAGEFGFGLLSRRAKRLKRVASNPDNVSLGACPRMAGQSKPT